MYIDNEISLLIGINMIETNKGAEKRRVETKEKIVSIARNLFSTNGYHNTQVMDIVNEAGMSAGTFYNYFNDKREIYEYISKENIAGLSKALQMLRMQYPEDNNVIINRLKIIRNAYESFFDYVEKNPTHLIMIMRGGYGVDSELDETTWCFYQSFVKDLVNDFENWRKQGIIKGSINYAILGNIIIGMALQCAHSYVIEKKFSQKDLIETILNVEKIIIESLLTEKGMKEYLKIKNQI